MNLDVEFKADDFVLENVYFGEEQVSIKEVNENIILDSILRFTDDFDMDVCFEWYMNEEYDFCYYISLLAGKTGDDYFAFINICYDEDEEPEDGTQVMVEGVSLRDYSGTEFFDVQDLLDKAAKIIKESLEEEKCH